MTLPGSFCRLIALQELNLQHTRVGGRHGGEVRAQWADVLQGCSNLQIMLLSFCSFDHEDARYLASALRKHHVLRALFLDNNCLRATGVQHFASALLENRSLQVLDVSANLFGEGGARELARALQKNSVLQSLVISGNAVSKTMQATINMALARNQEPQHKGAAKSLGLFVETEQQHITDLIELIRVVVKPQNADTFVDLGCGEGKLLRQVVKQTEFHGLGVDVDPDLICEAKKAIDVEHLAERLIFLCMPAEKLMMECDDLQRVAVVYLFSDFLATPVLVIELLEELLFRGVTIITHVFQLPKSFFIQAKPWPDQQHGEAIFYVYRGHDCLACPALRDSLAENALLDDCQRLRRIEEIVEGALNLNAAEVVVALYDAAQAENLILVTALLKPIVSTHVEMRANLLRALCNHWKTCGQYLVAMCTDGGSVRETLFNLGDIDTEFALAIGIQDGESVRCPPNMLRRLHATIGA